MERASIATANLDSAILRGNVGHCLVRKDTRLIGFAEAVI